MPETKAKVRFFGNDVCFQFARESNGSLSRKSTVTNIRKATDKEIEGLRQSALEERKYQNKGHGTQKRGYPIADSTFKVYLGESYLRFRCDGVKRKVKVWGEGFRGELPDRWESYDSINEEVE